MAGPCTRNAVGSNSGVGIGRGAEAAMSAVCAQAAAIGSSHVVGAGLRPALTKTYRKGSSYCICSVDLSPAPPLKRGLRLPCSVDGQWVHLSQRYRTPIDGMPRRGRPQGSPLQRVAEPGSGGRVCGWFAVDGTAGAGAAVRGDAN